MTDATLQRLRDDSGFAVVCDRCNGRRFLDGLLCPKCEGDGRIFIAAKPASLLSRIRKFWRKNGK